MNYIIPILPDELNIYKKNGIIKCTIKLNYLLGIFIILLIIKTIFT